MRLHRRSREQYLLAATEFVRRGEELPHSKLTAELVEEIRSARRQREALRQHIANNLSNEALAKKYGVHVRTIEKAITNETWSHV
jgi:hypothetical protein